MDLIEGSKIQLGLGLEGSYGAAGTTLVLARPNAGKISFALQKETFESEEIRSDRQVANQRHGVKSVNGGFTTNIFPSDLNDLMEAILSSSWDSAGTASTGTLQLASSGNTVVKPTDWVGFVQGDIVKIDGTTSNDGFAEVVSMSGLTLTLKNFALVNETSAAGTVKKLAKIQNGTTKKSMYAEIGYLDAGIYHLFKGLYVNSANFTIPPDGIATLAVDFMGKGMVAGTSSVDSSPTANSGEEPVAGIDASEAVFEGGVALSAITDLNFQIANSATNNPALGSDESVGGTQGRCRVTGNATMYFTSNDLMNKFINETESSLFIALTSPDDKTIIFSLPKTKYTSGAPQAAGEGAVTVAMAFTALADIGGVGKTITVAVDV